MFPTEQCKPAHYAQARQKYAGRIHYTVSEIKNNDLGVWKREQAENLAKWEAGREERYMNARESAVKILTGESVPILSKVEKAEVSYTLNRGLAAWVPDDSQKQPYYGLNRESQATRLVPEQQSLVKKAWKSFTKFFEK